MTFHFDQRRYIRDVSVRMTPATVSYALMCVLALCLAATHVTAAGHAAEHVAALAASPAPESSTTVCKRIMEEQVPVYPSRIIGNKVREALGMNKTSNKR